MKVDRDEYLNYIGHKIHEILVTHKHLKENPLFLDSPLEPYDDEVGRWVIMATEERDLFVGNWTQWLWGATQTLLGALEKELPSCKFKYAALYNVRDDTGIILGFTLSLMKEK